jgi:hypothetical protein
MNSPSSPSNPSTAANPPTPEEVREKMAQAGDVTGLFDLVTEAPPGTLDLRSVFAQIQRAIHISSQRDPPEFAESVFRRMAAFSTNVLVRLQYLSHRSLAMDGRNQLPEEFADGLLPKLRQIEAQLVDIFHAWASTSRMWQLARRGQKDKDDGQSKAGLPSPKSSRGSQTPPMEKMAPIGCADSWTIRKTKFHGGRE